MTYLSMKVAFVVTIALARRVTELPAMMAYSPRTVFYKEKNSACYTPNSSYRLSEFPINQSIHLLVSFLKPHACPENKKLHLLDLRYALEFYLRRTKTIRKSLMLFASIAERAKG